MLPSAFATASAPEIYSYAAQWLACELPCRRFAGILADADARLGAGMVRYSFTVPDFHRLLLAGLPAHCEKIWTLPFIAAFGEAKARRDWAWIWNAYTRATWISAIFGFSMVALMALISKPLIRVWATPAAVPTTSFVQWLSIYVMMGIALMPTNQFLSGLEKVTPLAVSTTLCAIGVVSMGILLARGHGLVGLAMAMAFSKSITFWPIQLYEVYSLRRGFFPEPRRGGNRRAA